MKKIYLDTVWIKFAIIVWSDIALVYMLTNLVPGYGSLERVIAVTILCLVSMILTILALIPGNRYTLDVKIFNIEKFNGKYYKKEGNSISFYQNENDEGLKELFFDNYEDLKIIQDNSIKEAYCEYFFRNYFVNGDEVARRFTLHIPTDSIGCTNDKIVDNSKINKQ